MPSSYLHLPKRTEAEARAAMTLKRLNAEFARRLQWKRSPEGQRYYAIGEEFRREMEERELSRLVDDLIARISQCI